jgi:hypothetical protein
MGRNEIPIDWIVVDDFLMAGSPGTEIADFFGIHANTLYNRIQEKYNCGFSEYCQQKKSSGEAMLRKQQFHKALGLTKDGDNTLLIWLGKQRLGQTEKQEGQVNVAEELRKFLVETFGSKGVSEPNSGGQTQQPLLDKRSDGQENQISNELGST